MNLNKLVGNLRGLLFPEEERKRKKARFDAYMKKSKEELNNYLMKNVPYEKLHNSLFDEYIYLLEKSDKSKEEEEILKLNCIKLLYLEFWGHPLKRENEEVKEPYQLMNGWVIDPFVVPTIFAIATDSGTNLDKDYYCKINNEFIKDKFTFQLPITPEESWVFVENYAVEYNKKYK